MSEIAAPARVALVGNPNSGKTALFNALTGSRQKVANYPGVTVERKEGLVVTPAGLAVRLIDLPGTYSLRARSLDEIVTRDIVLGRLESEATPSLLVCVANSTNLRVALRLALELKRVGRPMILALNMFDIARHRGFEIDLDRLSTELGIPVVASVAVRRGGTNDLLARIDAVIRERGLPRAPDWSEPNAAQLRATQREADRILDAAVKAPGRPDGFTRRLDRVVLHPVLGLVILLAILFLMFQAVFTWAQAPMDLIKSGFDALAAWAAEVLPPGLAVELRARRGHLGGRQRIGVPAADPHLVLLHSAARRFRLHGPGGLSDGPHHGRRRAAWPRFHPAAVELCLCDPRYHGDPGHLQPPRAPRDDPGRAADDLLGAHPGLHLDHRSLYPRAHSIWLAQSAGARDVRPLHGGYCQRARHVLGV